MKKYISILALILTLSGGTFVYAADSSTGLPGPDSSTGVPTTVTSQPVQKLQNPLRVDSIKDVIILTVNILIYAGISFAILAIIFVGFKFVMAQGNPEKINDAKRWFMWIIIGLAVLISARVIVDIIQNTLVKSGVVNESLWRP